MLFDKCVESVSTFSDLKREAAEYVIDYRQALLLQQQQSAWR